MTTQAQAILRPPAKRRIRTAKTGSARSAIGELVHGHEVYILTYGQFSLIDALVAIVDQTGPADVTLSTWTAAAADLAIAARLMETSKIRSLRFIVDRSFLTRQPDYCRRMRELFGDECIRTTRSHAKFIAIRNEAWNIAVRTSMNLNENPRLENIEISDDPALCAFLWSIGDDLWSEQPAAVFNGELPTLSSHADSGVGSRVAVGAVSRDGLRMATTKERAT